MSVVIELEFFEQQIDTIRGIPYVNEMSVRQAMEAGMGLGSEGPYCYTLRYYGAQYGYFVNAIGDATETVGVAGQVGFRGRACTFWALYVNGVLSNRGVDQTILEDGDTVTWRYETAAYAPEPHGRTVYELMAFRPLVAGPRIGD